MLIPVKKQTLIVIRVERDVFPLKPKLQYHLSQWRKCVYDAKSRNKGRLFCESMFEQIDEWTLILKLVERFVFLMEQKHGYHLPNKKNVFVVPNHEKKRD